MTVVCRMKQCPYNDGRSFCARFGSIGIDENGMCSALWRHGQRKNLTQSDAGVLDAKEPIVIVDEKGKQI